MDDTYRDILDLPRPDPVRHPRMAREDRAAQFAPFAALTGYGAAIDETARVTEDRAELDESERAVLDQTLALLAAHLDEEIEVDITYFRPDERKEGGAYVHAVGTPVKIDPVEGMLTMADGVRIPIADLCAIDFREEPRQD